MLVMKPQVVALIALGPIPGEDDEESPLEQWESALCSIAAPLTDEEAQAVLKLFPPDLAFGLGFTLLHLVEGAPSWSKHMASDISEPEWRERALRRLANAAIPPQ